MQRFILFLLILPAIWAYAQDQDTVKVLDEVVIKAFAHDRPLLDVPAAIAKISSADLERFSNTNILPALNAQPGVRMEERSPGSYRLSIRGSTLRSPFGVRNVKVYWNGIPLTDHGGNTYLNLLDFGSIDNLEIIKGPGSSLYGAGTGGVLLLEKNPVNKNRISGDAQGGSYGMQRYRIGADISFSKFNVGVDYAHQESDGYRQQSAMRRDMVGIRSNVLLGKKNSLSFNFFHSDLYYQTPGGLTKIQYDTLPTMARPGAVDKKAAVYNKTFFGGITLESDWGNRWTNTFSAFGNITEFENPTTRNYEKRSERMAGFRSVTQFRTAKGKLTFGAEFQPGKSSISVGANNTGVFTDPASKLRLPSTILFLFAQYDWNLPANFFLTAGMSVNKLTIKVDDLSNVNKRSFSPILSPRLALLKKLNQNWSAYVSYSQGYSPPTLAEIYPSNAVYNSTLKPETGSNYEAGIRGGWSFLQTNLTLYSFHLNQAIVLRRDNAGADYFVNAGGTEQNGAEVLVKLNLNNIMPAKQKLSYWISFTYNSYHFKNYFQDTISYSGNQMTGTPKQVMVWGLDYEWKGFYTNVTANQVSNIPLNDANTVYAKQYYLLGIRAGYRVGKNKQPLEIFIGGDNLMDKKYSLGNDLNAAGGRYYNAAPGRNFYAGLKLRLDLK